MDHALWTEIGVAEAALEDLQRFAALVEKWTRSINLISKGTIGEIWSRHIEDSARIVLHAPKDAALWADFGSGGGFPGIVAAVIYKHLGAPTVFHLVESDLRKATFLREAARHLALTTIVHSERAEKLAPLGAQVVSARALASLDQLCPTFERHGAASSIALFPKGETWEQEVDAARKNWSFDLEVNPDPGHKGSAILKLRNLSRAGCAPNA